jgi:outer membrane protein
MKIKIIIITILLLGARVLPGFAQQKPVDTSAINFSLAACINYAYQHQDSVMNATLDVKSAEYKIKETIATGLPQLNGSVSFQDYLQPPATVGPTFNSGGNPFSASSVNVNAPLIKYPFGAVTYNNTYSLTASQLLFSGTFIVGLKAVKTYKELSQRSLVRSKIETNVNVTKAYYQVLVSDEQIKLLNANIAQLKQQLDQTTQQNKQGFVEKIDVDRLTVQYDNLVTNRENTIRSLALNYDMLKFQMGMPISQNIALTDKLENIDLTQQVVQNNIDTAFYRNRIEYNLLETNLRLNELDVKSKKANFLPTFSANAGYGQVFQENHFRYLYDNAYPQSYIGVNLNIPIFSGGQRINQLRESEISVEKAKNNLYDAKNALNLQASSANITWYNSMQSLNTQKRSRELAQEVLHVAKVKYQQGVGSSLEVTQAETDSENADNQYIQALYNVLISKVDLDKAYGRIK